MGAPVMRIWFSGLIPFRDDLRSLLTAEQAELGDRFLAVPAQEFKRDLPEQIGVMAHQTLDRPILKQIPAVLYYSNQIAPRIGNCHRQIKSGRGHLAAAEAQP